MKVAHHEDHVTHAVIGGGEAMEFTFDDSDPTLMMVLSGALYSNQPLAVVRETLCNGWDAHIEAGKQNVPLQVTLTNEAVIFRDFGNGIAKNMIKPLFGTYGGSTKRANKFVTGGFGLGCKAPFSFTDHFQVTSYHDGERTIYNMSKSSAEVNGKPSILPIASFPTEETGVEVNIPLKTSQDRSRFESLIHEVVRNGEMLVELNGKQLNTYPFSKAEMGFLLVPLHYGNQIQIRLGNVIYPVPQSAEYGAELNRASKFVDKIAGLNERLSIIFQAPADSLSITPSRESLSLTPMTIATIRKLITECLDQAEANLQHKADVAFRSFFNEFNTPKKAWEVFDTRQTMPVSVPNRSILFKPDHLVQRLARYRLHGGTYGNMADDELFLRARVLQHQGIGDKDLLKSFRHALLVDRKLKTSATPAVNYWFMSQVIQPVKDAISSRDLPIKRLSIWLRESYITRQHSFEDYQLYENFWRDQGIAISRKIAAIGFSPEDIKNRIKRFPEMKGIDAAMNGVITFIVPRTYTKTPKVREAFESLGYTVLDMTIAQPWEKPDVVTPIVRAERNVKKGLPLLSGVRVGKRSFSMPEDPACSESVKARSEKPEFVLTVKRGKEGTELTDYLNEDASKAIMDMFAEKLGLAISVTQEEAYIKKGAKSLNTHLIELIVKEYETNPRIRAHLARDFTRIKLPGVFVCFMQAVEKIPELQPTLGLVENLTERDWNIISIARSLTKSVFFDSSAIEDTVNKVKLDSAFVSIINRMSCNKLMDVFDIFSLVGILYSPEPYSSKTRPALIEMIKLAVTSNSKETQK